jgi:hypothetical protein
MTLSSLVQLFTISLSALGLISACAGAPDERGWIAVGHTTRDEVVERFGQPDLVVAAEAGETVIYRARDSRQAAPRVEIPTVQAGPLGTTTTKMEPIRSDRVRRGPMEEIRIRYDARGIVQEVSP